MQKLNVLIAGDGVSADLIKASKYLNKLYITSDIKIDGCINIKFNTFVELAKKCKALKIDVVFVENEKWILQGISDVLRNNFINCIALNSNWANVLIDFGKSKNLLHKYKILTPKNLAYPNEFPVIVKSNRYVNIANSVSEVIKYRNKLASVSEEIARASFLEEFVEGNYCKITSVFDGKNLVSIPVQGLSIEKLLEYNQNLQEMLITENANFIGFFNSKIIYNDEIVNIGFDFEWQNFDYDILYLATSTIYQKLNEIQFI